MGIACAFEFAFHPPVRRFRTHPFKPREAAFSQVKYLNETPWTLPITVACTLDFTVHFCSEPLPGKLI